MKQPKKRWARTEAQQRHDQHGRSYYHNPTSAWYWERNFWKSRRMQTRRAFQLLKLGWEEEAVGFPGSPRNSLQWNYC